MKERKLLMVKKMHFVLVFIVIILASCSIRIEQSPSETPTITEDKSGEALPQKETKQPISVTVTAISKTPTPTPELTATLHITETPLPTSTIPAEARLEYRCLPITPNNPEAGTYNGTVVLVGSNGFPAYQLNIATGDMQPLLKDMDRDSFVTGTSSDNKWLAYTLIDPALLIIETFNDEKESISIPWEVEWSKEVWLNKQSLQIFLDDGSIIMLNPFSGERQSLFSDFPEYAEPIGVGADWWPAQYNSTLTRAVYPRYPAGDGKHIALWNLQTNKTIANFQSYVGVGPFGVKPVWSPSGNEFVMSLYQVDEDDQFYTELYRISADGDLLKITNLRAYYPEFLSIREYQWSPDGSQIAFWLRYSLDDMDKEQLAVLDMETFKVTNYCIDDRWGTSRELIWSPNGRQLIVNGRLKEEPTVLLLDLDNRDIYQIAGDLRAVGWMASSP